MPNKAKKETKTEREAATGLSSPQALNQAVWKICDVMRAAGVGSAIRYVPELTWLLFLRVLDEQEAIEQEEAEALGLSYAPSLVSPCIAGRIGRAFTGSGAGVKTNLVFFTKGRRTERIWYYDLSQIKVGKKTPLTMAQFREFFELLDKRGTPEAETARSWSVDFSERRRKAQAEAAPHRREADAQRERATTLREEAKAHRKAQRAKLAETLMPQIDAAEKAARDSLAKAQGIEDAVYDLKAVNPRETKIADTRTPAQLLVAIADKGREVDAALERLRSLIEAA